ncbi:amino acid permease [Hirsutella rhossiliensis]|uniref:Amino acid permease domain-containing protein n=1 Tax=Hirsutella rhossiliensis TaxID=111463 RepID=A0A9P8N5J7_9HYPO|nr:amino acid permease domain-containing protein [Hirsutella rhossiliensis]KAH0967179.1 amino acid permease domain-containing protein [Hirsutella rhossiliensis]
MAPHRDIELNTLNNLKVKEDSFTHGSSHSMREPDYERRATPRIQRFIDSFKRDADSTFFPSDHLSQVNSVSTAPNPRGAHYYDLHLAAVESVNTGLARKLKGRHLQMIAIGGSIGTGLFVASGKSLSAGGPASLLISFTIVGVMLYCTCQALGELSVIFPIAGSFSSWATRFLDPSWGFAMGWNYALQWLTVLPLEIIAASMTIRYWNEELPSAIFVAIFLSAIMLINLFGVKGYGEAEFTFSIVKVIAVIGFILLGIVLNCGGTPDRGYIGGEYWQNPGAFNNGFKGLCSVFVTAAFAFSGTELVGLAAAETANPRKSLPTAIKQVFWRITLFYIVALTLVGLLVRYDDPRLQDYDSNADAKASPFVIAIDAAGIEVLPSIMNAVILVAVLSVGNSAVFGSSRTLAAMAKLSQAPRFLGYVDRRGRPLVAIGLAGAFGLLAFLADLSQRPVLDWLLAISGLSTVFTWASICLCHIRFRRAWALRGRSLDDIPFVSQVGVLGSWIGLVLNVCILVAQFWVGAFPIRWETMARNEVVKNFFLKCVGVPIIFLFYLVHKLFYRTAYIRLRDMDVDTGRRDFNLPILKAQEHGERAAWPRWKRFYKFIC